MNLHLVFFTIIPVAIAQLLQDPADTEISAGGIWGDSLVQDGVSGHLFDALDLPSSNMVSLDLESQSNHPLPSEPGYGSGDSQTVDTTIAGCSTPQPPGRKLRARQPQSGGICSQSQGKPLKETPLRETPLHGKPVEGIPLEGTNLQWIPFGATPLGWEVDWPAPKEENSRNPQFYPSPKDQSREATRSSVKQCEKNMQTYCCGGPEEPHPRGTLNVNDCVWCKFLTLPISKLHWFLRACLIDSQFGKPLCSRTIKGASAQWEVFIVVAFCR